VGSNLAEDDGFLRAIYVAQLPSEGSKAVVSMLFDFTAS
jgi:hypothetical protein